MKNIFLKPNFEELFSGDPGKWQPKARRDWKIIFFAVLFVLFFSLSAHFYLFSYVTTNDVYFRVSSEDEMFEGALNKRGLKTVAELIREKNSRTEKILANPLQIADPSLP